MVAALPDLVERDDELALLSAMLRDDGGQLLLIEGEAGTGKTELLRAAVADAPGDISVLVGTCEPLEIPAAFSPLFEVLHTIPDALADEVRSGTDGLAVYSAFLDLLRTQRTLLVIDDVQWADPATVGLLRYLGRRIGDTPSVLVIAFRPAVRGGDEDIADLLAELGRRGTRLESGALSLGGVRVLADGSGLDPATVLRRTGGNPLFVSEVVRHPDDEVPASIEQAVASRVRRLSNDAQRLVETISLCPDGLDVNTALGLGAGDQLDEAIERSLLQVDGDRVRFRHDLIRSSILRSLPPLRQRELHHELASALEPQATTPRDISHLAFHFAGAGEGRRAIDYSRRSARDAIAADAHRTAADNLARALEFRDLMAPEELDDTLRSAADELILVGRFEEAIRAAEDRLPLARNDIDRAAVLVQLGHCRIRAGDYDRGVALAADSLALVPPSDRSGAALAERLLGAAAMGACHWESAIDHHRTSAALAHDAGDVEGEALSLTYAGTSMQVIGDPGGCELIEQAVRLGLDHGLHDVTAMSLNNFANALLGEFRLDEARTAFERGIEYCATRQLDSWHMGMLPTLALVELRAGEPRSARRLLAERVAGPGSPGSEREAAGVVLRLDMRSTGKGDDDLERAIEELNDSDLHHFDRVDVLPQVAEAGWLGACDGDVARASLTAAYSAPGFLEDPWACGQAAFWAIRLEHPLPPATVAGPFGLEASGVIERAAAEWVERGCPYEAALTRARLLEPPIDDIARVLLDLGAPAALAAVRRDLRDRGIDARSTPEREHPSGLTPRQLEVLGLLGEGLSNAEIGERLYISRKTAGHHVSAILAATGTTSRGQAVALARAKSWL